MVKVIGSYISPYVRKVLVCLNLKGIGYEIDPIIPFFGNTGFSLLSPLRRIPVLIDDKVTLADSTVICEYLDDRYGDPPLYPRKAVPRARARWLEEYADSRLGEALIWGLFNQRVINRFVWGEQADPARVAKTLERDVPEILGYLEGLLPVSGWLFGEISMADVAIASFFRNAAFAGLTVDAGRWPTAAAFIDRALGHVAFAELRKFEDIAMRTPIERHREALAEAGAPVTPTTLATSTPRRGVLRT